MLLDIKKIRNYLLNVPPVPEDVKICLEFLNQGELQKAADSVDGNIVLKKNIESIVNSAYFGLSKKVTNTRQLFSFLGVETAKGVVYTYLVSLLKPKEFKIFKKLDFHSFQIDFLSSAKESIILECGEDIYKKYAESLAIIPASVCIVDSILGEKEKELKLIMENSDLNYGQVFERFTNMTLFSLASKIAKIWELSEEIQQIIKNSECKSCEIEKFKKLSATIHLTLFRIVSKSEFIALNSLITFNIETTKIATKNFERMLNET